MRDFSVVQRMDLFVVRVALTLSGKAQPTQTLSQTHACTRTYSRAATADRLQGQTGGSAASLTPLILFSISPPTPTPSLSPSLCLSVSPFCPHPFLPPFSFSPSPCVSDPGPFLPYHFPFLLPSSSLHPLPVGQLLTSCPDPFAPTLLFPVTPAANLVCPQQYCWKSP